MPRRVVLCLGLDTVGLTVRVVVDFGNRCIIRDTTVYRYRKRSRKSLESRSGIGIGDDNRLKLKDIYIYM